MAAQEEEYKDKHAKGGGLIEVLGGGVVPSKARHCLVEVG